jgi:hypothetical protein
LTSGYNIQTYNLEIGGVHNQYPNRMYYEGFLDEVRVSSITRSPEWISTSFNNQQDPGSFLSIGPEEPGP